MLDPWVRKLVRLFDALHQSAKNYICPLPNHMATGDVVLTAYATIVAPLAVSMEVVFQPDGGTQNNIMVTTYSVSPHAGLLVELAGLEVWGPPASPPPDGMAIAVAYTKGSPDRGNMVQLTATQNGSSVGAIPPIDVSGGTNYYRADLYLAVIASGSASLQFMVDTASAEQPYLDAVAQDAEVKVSQPPTIGFQLAGSDGKFVDASNPSIRDEFCASLETIPLPKSSVFKKPGHGLE